MNDCRLSKLIFISFLLVLFSRIVLGSDRDQSIKQTSCKAINQCILADSPDNYCFLKSSCIRHTGSGGEKLGSNVTLVAICRAVHGHCPSPDTCLADHSIQLSAARGRFNQSPNSCAFKINDYTLEGNISEVGFGSSEVTSKAQKYRVPNILLGDLKLKRQVSVPMNEQQFADFLERKSRSTFLKIGEKSALESKWIVFCNDKARLSKLDPNCSKSKICTLLRPGQHMSHDATTYHCVAN